MPTRKVARARGSPEVPAMDEHVIGLSDRELITAAIEASGLSARRFAERMMTRDERTIRRWISGDQELPEVARRRLTWFLELTESQRERLIALLDRD